MLGTQLLAVLGRAMAPGPGKGGSGKTLGSVPRDGGFSENKNLLHPSELRENLGQLTYVRFVGFFFYLYIEFK